jgi:ELWxxDGT repeat protein
MASAPTRSYMTNVNGVLYFRAADANHGFELWRSTGTAAGTKMVQDINPGLNSSYPGPMANVNGALFFSAIDATHGREPWVVPRGSVTFQDDLALTPPVAGPDVVIQPRVALTSVPARGPSPDVAASVSPRSLDTTPSMHPRLRRPPSGPLDDPVASLPSPSRGVVVAFIEVTQFGAEYPNVVRMTQDVIHENKD